jgi:hypothetical protein
MNTLINLLQQRNSFVSAIENNENVNKRIIDLLITGTVAFAGYGAIIGLQQGLLQALAGMLKLPILYLLTLAICLPTYFIFDSFLGSRSNIKQTIAMALTGITTTAILLIGFAPVTLFFLVTMNNYVAFKLLNVLFFTISGFAGARLLYRLLLGKLMNDDTVMYNRRKRLLNFWMLLYAFVGTQMAWTLRPFFGVREGEFIFFQEVRGNFYENLFRNLVELIR